LIGGGAKNIKKPLKNERQPRSRKRSQSSSKKAKPTSSKSSQRNSKPKSCLKKKTVAFSQPVKATESANVNPPVEPS